MNALDFVPVWTLILGAGIFFYVLLDGFDLGVGMLYGFMPDTRSRNTVMSAIAPVWDGNETWLVLGGVGLLAAFPLAFAIIVPALYFPVAVMLLALVFRGVAFEFRFRDAERRTFWDHGFFCGSVVATVAQGIMLGAFIQGFRVEGRVFVGTAFDFLTPFSILTGIALVFGYGLLGAGWLVLKTEGEIQERARRYGRLWLAGVLVALLLVSVSIRSLHRRHRALLSVLRRHCDQPVAHDRSASLHTVASRVVAEHAGLPYGWHALPSAGHPRLYGLVILGLPRKGTC
jgi:cytochrome d ubiquinol oxidase subunit II